MKAVAGIVTHDRPELLSRTLESLSRCDRPAAFAGVVVVENGPRRASRDLIADFSNTIPITYREMDSSAKCEALNEILRLVDRELVIFLDDDVRVAGGLLDAYCRQAETEGPGTYFGGPTGVDYEAPPEDWLRPFLPLSAVGFELGPDRPSVRYPSCFLGFNWAAFADDLKACGGFSSRFGPGTPVGGGDESFMQLRLTKRGRTGRYVPEAMVWHFVPRDRCSAEWALARARGAGKCAGLFEEHRYRSQGRRVPTSRVFLRQLARRIGPHDLFNLLCLRSAGRFWLRHTARWMAGFCHGLSQGAQETPLDEETWRAAGYRPPNPREQAELSSCR